MMGTQWMGGPDKEALGDRRTNRFGAGGQVGTLVLARPGASI